MVASALSASWVTFPVLSYNARLTVAGLHSYGTQD